MRGVWTPLRHSVTWWGGLAVAAVEIWSALTSRTAGWSLWTDLVSGLSFGSLYTGIVAAGFSAFEAGRWSGPATEHARASTRNPALIRLRLAAVAAAPLLAGYLLALAVLTVYARVTGAYGAPSPVWLFTLGCALTAASGFGWVVGLLGRGRWWASPAAAMLFFGAYIVVRVLPLPNGVKALFPVVLAADFVFVTPVLPTMLGMAAFTIGAAVLALLYAGRGRRGSARRPLIALTIISATLIAGGAVAVTSNGRYTDPIAARDQEICQTRSAEICMNRGYAAALPALHRQFTRLNARVVGTPLVATRLEQGIAGGVPVRAGFRRFDIFQLASHDDITSTVSDYVLAYGMKDQASPACLDGSGGHLDAHMFVTAWLSGYENWSGDPGNIKRYRALQAFTPVEGAQWFRQHHRQYFTCTLRLDDLP